MTASAHDIEAQALDWLIRVNDPAFSAWDDWTRWLEADPAHTEVYWRLAEREADMVEALATRPSRPLAAAAWVGPHPRFIHREALVAAAVVLALGLGWFAWSERPQPWTIETGPGERRTVALSDGSRVSLAGGTRLRLDRGEPRQARLDSGRALFEVVHNARAPFRVNVGDTVLTDLGTTFDVTTLADGVRVSVSEGVVRVDRRAASETLRPGEGVLVTARGLERREVSPDAVTEWREGRLSWTGETLKIVAEDLQRALGRPVEAAPAVASRRFTGSLSVESAPADLRERLSRLLGVDIVEEGGAWRLEP